MESFYEFFKQHLPSTICMNEEISLFSIFITITINIAKKSVFIEILQFFIEIFDKHHHRNSGLGVE